MWRRTDLFSTQIPFVLAAMERALVRYFQCYCLNNFRPGSHETCNLSKRKNKNTCFCVYDSLIPAKMITYEEIAQFHKNSAGWQRRSLDDGSWHLGRSCQLCRSAPVWEGELFSLNSLTIVQHRLTEILHRKMCLTSTRTLPPTWPGSAQLLRRWAVCWRVTLLLRKPTQKVIIFYICICYDE